MQNRTKRPIEKSCLDGMGILTAVTRRGGSCQDAGPHPLRYAAKKERIINEH
jgi:hypothetical protein